jgi:tribbles-like protein
LVTATFYFHLKNNQIRVIIYFKKFLNFSIMSTPATLTRIVTKRRQVEADLQQITYEGANSNKRQKIANSNGIDKAVNSATSNVPLSPLPEPTTPKQQQLVKIANGKLQSIGPYELLAPLEENSQTFTAVDTRCQDRLVICRRLDRSKYTHMMRLADRFLSERKPVDVDEEDETRRAYEQIFPAASELIVGDDGHYYYFEPKNFGSLHSYVVERKRLSEQECLWYARQIVRLLAYCHRNRVILRDLKLRKFVFQDAERLTIRLDGLDELFVCPDLNNEDEEDEDRITDRHGCPAYVGPEILDLNQKSFSGRQADMWSLGVLVFVILYGRYPFYDTTPARLFAKIRHAQIHMIDEPGISFEARTFIRCLLRRDPSERPSALEILAHPWLQTGVGFRNSSSTKQPQRPSGGAVQSIMYGYRMKNFNHDQCVPCLDTNQENNKTKSDKKINQGVNQNRDGRRRLSEEIPAVPNQ